MLRGTRRPIGDRAIPEKKISVAARLHNRFDVEVLDAKTGELKQTAVGYNIICNALWNYLLSTNSDGPASYPYFKYILFGSGSGTPAATDTALFSYLGGKALSASNSNDSFTRVFRPAQSMGYAQASITLQAEEYVGSTITEVGIGYDSTHCATHAMLQDMNGNPISITKTDTDVIKIYATVYLHWTTGGAYGGMLNLALNSSAALKSSLLGCLTGSHDNAWWSWKGVKIKRTSRSNVVSGNTTATALSTSVSRTQRKFTIRGRIAAGEHNGPIGYIEIENAYDEIYLAMGSWFTPPPITAEAVGTGDGSKQDFSTTFPVKTAGTVYVDGVAASGVTVRPGPPNGAALQSWLMIFYTIASGNPYLRSAIGLSFDSDGRAWMTQVSKNMGYYFFNRFAATGIGKVDLYNGSYSDYVATWQVDMSADGSTWTRAGSVTYEANVQARTTKTVSIPTELQHLPYMRIVLTELVGTSTTSTYYFSVSAPGENLSGNIHFDVAPAAGAVITADYTPDCIAKDSNHVFDLTLELTLGEYQEV